MIWRWIIRGLCLALLTLCAVAWAGSYRRGIQGGHAGKMLVFVDLSHGRMLVDYEKRAWFTGWQWTYYRVKPASWKAFDKDAQFHYAGFAVRKVENVQTLVTIPLWFPTLLSTLFLWLIWRKTRPKHPAKGFPVEPAGTAPKKAP